MIRMLSGPRGALVVVGFLGLLIGGCGNVSMTGGPGGASGGGTSGSLGGKSGAAGAGAAGASGAAGAGVAGTSGAAGTTGVAGAGAAGTTGVAGAGAAGTSGASGTGAAGASGAAGATGVAGASGVAGTSGGGAGGEAGSGNVAGHSGGAGSGGTAGAGGVGGGAAGGTGAGGAAGAGCPSTSTSTGTRYVDHAAGTDDAVHGGGTGACAYKTLTYAVGKAPAEISLSAADTYQAGVAGETVPFLLQGKQTLNCNGATLANAASSGTYNGIVQFAGTTNGATGCTFNGEQIGGYCFLVNTSGASTTAPHTITQNTFNNCGGEAIVVGSGFNNVSIANNSFTLDYTCIDVMGTSTGVKITDNTFAGTTTDIMCAVADPGVTGSGNLRGGGATVCKTCGNCPF
jgi:hypothetical protein